MNIVDIDVKKYLSCVNSCVLISDVVIVVCPLFILNIKTKT